MNRTRFEQRRASDLLLESSKTTQERLALPLTACLKLLRQALLDHLGPDQRSNFCRSPS